MCGWAKGASLPVAVLFGTPFGARSAVQIDALMSCQGSYASAASAGQDRDQPLVRASSYLATVCWPPSVGWLAATEPADRSQDSPGVSADHRVRPAAASDQLRGRW